MSVLTATLMPDVSFSSSPYSSDSSGDSGYSSADNAGSNITFSALNNTTHPHAVNMSATGPLSLEQQHQLSLIKFWVNGVITNFVVVLGLIGNILTIVILSQRAMHSSTNVYLTGLAAWDSVVLIGTELLIGLPGIPNFTFYMNYIFPFVICYVYPLALVAQTATIWLTVSFTVERFIAVRHPLKAASMCTIYRAKIVIACVSAGAFIYNLPRWFEYRTVRTTDPHTNATMFGMEETAFGRNSVYLQVYFSWLYVPMMCCIPLSVLSVLNTFLVLAVRKSRRTRKDMNVKQTRENNVTIMLAAVVIVFIVCQVPALVYNISFAINKERCRTSFGYLILSEVRNFLVNLNSSINFILYCVMGQKFRKILIHTLCRHCVRDAYMPMSGVHSTTMMSMSSQRRFNNRRDMMGSGRAGKSDTPLTTGSCKFNTAQPNTNNHHHYSTAHKPTNQLVQTTAMHTAHQPAKNARCPLVVASNPPGTGRHKTSLGRHVGSTANGPITGTNTRTGPAANMSSGNAGGYGNGSGSSHGNQHVHTYAPLHDGKRRSYTDRARSPEPAAHTNIHRDNLNGHHGMLDSDEDDRYDISLEKLLPDKEREGTPANAGSKYRGYAPERMGATGKSTVSVC